MRYGDIVMFAFGPLPGKVSCEIWIMDADISGRIENGIAYVLGEGL